MITRVEFDIKACKSLGWVTILVRILSVDTSEVC